jgi:hypothetical protein
MRRARGSANDHDDIDEANDLPAETDSGSATTDQLRSRATAAREKTQALEQQASGDDEHRDADEPDGARRRE